MSELDKAFQFSVKVGGNILVVGGSSIAEFKNNFQELFGENGWAVALADFETRVLRADEKDAGSDKQFDEAQQTVQQGLGQNPGLGNQPPAGGQQGGNGPAPRCDHGERTYREGVSKKGKWTAWFCPQPKGSAQCDPIWGS